MAVKTATAVKKVRELTEEDVLKAPEKDYMNEAQLAFFRRRLIELRDQLLQNADDTGEHLRENEITTDPSDRATLEEEYTLELRTRDRERKLLKKVEKSLRMIDDGSYGYHGFVSDVLRDLIASGTRREELLLKPEILQKSWILRKLLYPMDEIEAM